MPLTHVAILALSSGCTESTVQPPPCNGREKHSPQSGPRKQLAADLGREPTGCVWAQGKRDCGGKEEMLPQSQQNAPKFHTLT